MIDRPMRPLSPEGHYKARRRSSPWCSARTSKNAPDIMAINGAAFALYCSPIPPGAVGAVRIGHIGGEFVVNPSIKIMDQSRINLVVAGTKGGAICMVEAGAQELSEEEMIQALQFAHDQVRRFARPPRNWPPGWGSRRKCPSPRLTIRPIWRKWKPRSPALREAMATKGKLKMYDALDKVKEDLLATYPADQTERRAEAGHLYHEVLVKIIPHVPPARRTPRGRTALRRSARSGARWASCPRTHGSRPVRPRRDHGPGQLHPGHILGHPAPLRGSWRGTEKRFMLHYNFPPFSVGEVKFLRGPGRREIGHGALAEKAILPVLPDPMAFPYTVRIVSDILESNGSSSMASICGGTLALLDAGVPLKAPVAGVAMGLVKEGDSYAILTDIAGVEDHYGDMDFKVAGTAKGMTALQMDIKVGGISFDIMREALAQANKGRMHLLDCMAQVLPASREDISPLAPRIYAIQIAKSRIGELIGPGGKNVRHSEATGVDINIEEDGTVQVASCDAAAAEKARP